MYSRRELCNMGGPCKERTTNKKWRLIEPFGQQLFVISTALLLIKVEKPHIFRNAWYKYQTNGCKNHPEKSTRPKSS